MNSQIYRQLLRSPKWSLRVSSLKQKKGNRCFYCLRSGMTKDQIEKINEETRSEMLYSEYVIEVHHLFYVYGKSPWEYPDELLIPTCPSCHDYLHSRTTSKSKLELIRAHLTTLALHRSRICDDKFSSNWGEAYLDTKSKINQRILQRAIYEI